MSHRGRPHRLLETGQSRVHAVRSLVQRAPGAASRLRVCAFRRRVLSCDVSESREEEGSVLAVAEAEFLHLVLQGLAGDLQLLGDRKSTRLNSSHVKIS